MGALAGLVASKTLCLDQGSDGLCAGAFLRHLQANVTLVTDWSHGGQNDFYDALREGGLWPFCILMLVVFNCEHGPFDDDVRWAQLESAWREATTNYTATSLALFQDRLPAIIAENGGTSGVLFGEASDDVEAVLWSRMSSGWRPKGHKTNLNRF